MALHLFPLYAKEARNLLSGNTCFVPKIKSFGGHSMPRQRLGEDCSIAAE